ncbi:MAG TPA: bifunctional DNA-formamidopyrimidine glycosylase/DNA-(apurinic or apyrimidinic site) lyase [Candidatus Sulfotelmatobacter sp.]|nr:bifunctional DNA-formamidopyrimidine glycosylase/DNA-(apurinic or apyrimidinic site) lyase [Candidatus Sulfotelmatobacter sp.]
MPELPEVEAVAISLRPLVTKRRIRSVEVFHPIAVLPQSAAHVSRLLTGRRIKSVQRKGKYLFLVLDNQAAIEMHFRFDGQLIRFANAKEVEARANKKTDGGIHVDLALELDKGVMAFADGRHLGRVHAWESLASCPPYNELGVDAMSAEFTAKTFAELVGKSRRPLKEFLLDQSRVAGVGNIYSCEALWYAKISPFRLANSLKPEEIRAVYRAIGSVLRRALQCCLNPPPNFSDAGWWFQGIEDLLRVYQREGEPCRRDGHPIRRTTTGNRSTYFCAHCQK